MQQLILMQGVPGSGKSTEARKIAQRLGNCQICSTDGFHHVGDEYVFDVQNLSYYHAWNLWQTEHYLNQGKTVIVDNTNIKKAHAKPYVDLARRKGIIVQVVRCDGPWQSVHHVPAEIVERMRLEMENLL